MYTKDYKIIHTFFHTTTSQINKHIKKIMTSRLSNNIIVSTIRSNLTGNFMDFPLTTRKSRSENARERSMHLICIHTNGN